MPNEPVSPIISLAEAQAFVRLDSGDEEALLAGLIRAATTVCETFLNQIVIARTVTEVVVGTGEWQALRNQPVRAVSAVLVNELLLPPEEYGLEIDRCGKGWLRLRADARASVQATVGLALDENDVPEPIRQGVLRLTSHLYSHRDGSAATDAPAIVTALWRPYRQMVLA